MPVDMDILERVRDWHDEEGCCKHPDGIVQAESVCCVCDAESPCDFALDEAASWVPDDEWDFICDKPARFCSCDDDYERLRDEQMGI